MAPPPLGDQQHVTSDYGQLFHSLVVAEVNIGLILSLDTSRHEHLDTIMEKFQTNDEKINFVQHLSQQNTLSRSDKDLRHQLTFVKFHAK